MCSWDLHRHWIKWTLLCDTMMVSMLCLTWLTIAQHIFQPALTGWLELISRKNCLLRAENKDYHCEQLLRKIVSRKLGPSSYREFVKNIALLGAKKWGPTCDHDISNSAIYTTTIYREYIVSARYFVWNFTWNILPIYWKIWFLDNVVNLRDLRLTSLLAFFKRPPNSLMYTLHPIKHSHSQMHVTYQTYRKVSNIRRTKYQNLNDSRLILQLSVPNPLKPSVKSIMKM